jgi:predicted Zn-ribbon and HTH transcriptional regulator
MDKFNERFNKIMEGCNADQIMKLEQEITERMELLETMKLSAGMVRGFRKTANIKAECGGCGFGMPKYAGRYPNYCPSCGEKIEASVKHPHADVPNDTPLDEANKYKKDDAIAFMKTVISKKGKVTTADFKKHNIPFEYFLRMAFSGKTPSNDQLVKGAQDMLNKLGELNEVAYTGYDNDEDIFIGALSLAKSHLPKDKWNHVVNYMKKHKSGKKVISKVDKFQGYDA